MAAYYLAVDIGASSGRHILGHMENGKMVLEEIYRFENGMVKKDGELCWEFDRLFKEVVNGLKKCKEIGKIPVSMGVDTWGVDFVLLDKNDNVLGNTVGYRDHRTEGMDKEVYKAISLKDLYARTGIQKADYNTIYQLMAVKKKHPEYLEQAETLLHVPDYFHFLLTGQKTCEYTEATTGQLVSPITKDWDYELIDMLGYPRKMFQKLIMQYQCALLEVKTKFEVLNHELSINSDQNPILSIESRIKKPISILEKMKRKNIEISVQAIEENICDIAGIRVICCFPKDIYTLAEKICEQDDIRLIERKDYIKNPKPNGYRSLHLILEVPVFFMNEKKPMKVEVQMRTIAMDFWASIEHKLYYKKQTDGFPDSVSEDLGICAEQLHTIDMKMQEISERIYHQER